MAGPLYVRPSGPAVTGATDGAAQGSAAPVPGLPLMPPHAPHTPSRPSYPLTPHRSTVALSGFSALRTPITQRSSPGDGPFPRGRPVPPGERAVLAEVS